MSLLQMSKWDSKGHNKLVIHGYKKFNRNKPPELSVKTNFTLFPPQWTI